jgi:hypothetical protein
MQIDFSAEYAHRSDDELLHLASARGSLTTEAAAALDTELRRRNLTETDRIERQRFVKRQENRESRLHHRKSIGPFKDRFTLVDLLWALLGMAAILVAYFALPRRYRLDVEWQEAAVCVLISSTLIAAAGRKELWPQIVFWISLALSSAIHLILLHQLAQRVAIFSSRAGKVATLLGFSLFLVVYGLVSLLRRNFYGKEVSDNV